MVLPPVSSEIPDQSPEYINRNVLLKKPSSVWKQKLSKSYILTKKGILETFREEKPLISSVAPSGCDLVGWQFRWCHFTMSNPLGSLVDNPSLREPAAIFLLQTLQDDRLDFAYSTNNFGAAIEAQVPVMRPSEDGREAGRRRAQRVESDITKRRKNSPSRGNRERAGERRQLL